jgi:hypothetical protein
MYDYLVEKIESGVQAISTAWIPKKPWIAAVAAGASWYGRRVALTYAPGKIADFCINRTIVFMGSETAGKIVGATIVAPLIVPDLTPLVAVAAGAIAFYLIAAIGNLVQHLFERWQQSRQPPIVEAQVPAALPVALPARLPVPH